MKLLVANKLMYLWLLLAFCLGITAKVAIDEIDFISAANAEVAGMDYYDLKSDYDFKKAVRRIVENCSVDGESISCWKFAEQIYDQLHKGIW